MISVDGISRPAFASTFHSSYIHVSSFMRDVSREFENLFDKGHTVVKFRFRG